MDKSGTNCNPGQTISNLNNVPVGDTASATFISQAPLANNKIKWFTADRKNNCIQLQWNIDAVNDIKQFEVQRKKNTQFETIGYVSPASFSDNRNELTGYTFYDTEISKAAGVYYRVKQVSYTGKESYSEIRAVRTGKTMEVLIYPNPNNGKLNIVLPNGNGYNEIIVSDFSGKQITVLKTNNSAMHLQGLQKGIYLITISNIETGERVSQKITVL